MEAVMNGETKEEDKSREMQEKINKMEELEMDESITVEDLQIQLQASKAEIAKAKEEIGNLNQQLAISIPRSQALVATRELENRINNLTKDRQALTEGIEQEQKEREWLESELRAQYEAASATEAEMSNLQNFVRKLHNLVEDKNVTIDQQKKERELDAKKIEDSKEEATKLKKETELKNRVLQRTEEQHRTLASVAKMKEEEAIKQQKEASVARRQYVQLQKELIHMEKKKDSLEQQAKRHREEVSAAEKQLSSAELLQQQMKRKATKLTREKDFQFKNFTRVQTSLRQQAGQVHIGELERQSLKKELTKTRTDLGKQSRLVAALFEERTRQAEEMGRIESKVMELATEIEARGREVERAFHSERITEAQLTQKTRIVETLKEECYSVSRHLRDSVIEKTKLEEEVNKDDYIISKFQDNLATRDHEIQKLLTDIKNQSREKENLKSNLANHQKQIDSQKMDMQYSEGEKLGLQKVIGEQENSLSNVSKELEEEKRRRVVVSTQLCRRNDEVSSLRQRVRLLEHILRKGDKEYGNRNSEAITLCNEVNLLRDERDVLLHQVQVLESLKDELIKLRKELVSSETKRSALEEEVLKREKMHRWNTLKISDPEKSELLRKNQVLQKRLLAATRKVVSTELELEQKRRELDELRRVVDRTVSQSGSPEGMALLRLQSKQQLREKEDQIKSVTAALNSAVLSVEEAEMEKKNFKTEIAALRLTLTRLQKRQNRTSPSQRSLGSARKIVTTTTSVFPVSEQSPSRKARRKSSLPALKRRTLGAGFNVQQAPTYKDPEL